MSEEDEKYLDLFPTWLSQLGEDAQLMTNLLRHDGVPDPVVEAVAGGLNYLFKSLDLIPDGIDDIGYLDDAIVLRVAAAQSLREDLAGVGKEVLQPAVALADQCEPIRAFLGEDFARLESYVQGLRQGSARGRAVADIVRDKTLRAEFISEVELFSKNYEPPGFAKEQKNLIKLRAFFDAKLPR
ncbi:MAG: YkvA family protein [Myxococcota bacterium]